MALVPVLLALLQLLGVRLGRGPGRWVPQTAELWRSWMLGSLRSWMPQTAELWSLFLTLVEQAQQQTLPRPHCQQCRCQLLVRRRPQQLTAQLWQQLQKTPLKATAPMFLLTLQPWPIAFLDIHAAAHMRIHRTYPTRASVLDSSWHTSTSILRRGFGR